MLESLPFLLSEWVWGAAGVLVLLCWVEAQSFPFCLVGRTLKSHFCGTPLSPFRVGLVSEVMRVLTESQGTPTLEAVALSHLLLASPLPPALHLVVHLLSSPLAASSDLLSHLAKGRVAMEMHFALCFCVCVCVCFYVGFIVFHLWWFFCLWACNMCVWIKLCRLFLGGCPPPKKKVYTI